MRVFIKRQFDAFVRRYPRTVLLILIVATFLLSIKLLYQDPPRVLYELF